MSHSKIIISRKNNYEKNKKHTNTSILDKHRISVVICEECNNSNLTKIHENVYIYPGLYEKTNILI
ncbi:MAG: hypothetical protein DRN05_05360 [Thermoplasmata archaeon]|nr:MAG: hypothetical protein DRN05_05360 [Thermoplasmata archaeon]